MRRVLISLILLLGLAGCGLRPQLVDPASTGEAPFRPVTQAPPITPTAVPIPTSVHATPVVTCIDKLTYVSDQTIPDGTEVAPNSSLDKRWEVQNSGTCNWDERYQLRLVGGPDLGANAVQPLFPARSGSTATIRIEMTAPAKSGSYRSAWQAYNPNDEPFGDPFYIEIVVK